MADENIVDELVDTKVVNPPAEPAAATVDTLASNPPADKTPAAKPTVAGDWPADWRDKASGGDEKKAQRLSRYASPQALADALIAAQNKISAGDLKVSIGKDAKPEEIAAYREAHGIPAEASKYDIAGIEFEETEKPMIEKFLTEAHSVHMTPDHVRAALGAYSKISEDARNQRVVQDNEAKEKAEDALRADWGNDFRTNINLVTNLLDGAPQGVREKLLHGRLSDGTPIGSSPEVLNFLVGLARERNPSGVVVPSGVATESSVENEIKKIEGIMRTDRQAYNRDVKMQERFRQLLAWRENQRTKAA